MLKIESQIIRSKDLHQCYMRVLDSAVHEVSCFWGGWRTCQPSTGCPACNDYQESSDILIGLQLYGSSFFASVSREYLQTKLWYSWWSFVGLRNGAFSLALFCISLASFLQDTQSKRRICFQHGRWPFPVRWMFILGKNGTFTPQKTNISHQWESETHLLNGQNWMGYISSQEGRYLQRTSLNKRDPSSKPQSWSQILKGSSGQ